MPYFRWQGVNLQGELKKGGMFAPSVQLLDTLLFKQDIALIKSRERRPYFIPAISQADLLLFLQNVVTLLKAGLLISDVLTLLGNQAEQNRMQEVIYHLEHDVQHGSSLSDAMSKHPAVFNLLVIHMTHVGQETGALAQSLEITCTALEQKQQFMKQLRSAALVPAVTLIFFLIMTGIIFVIIVPYFAQLFASMQQQLPPVTRMLMSISSFMRSWYMMLMLGMINCLTIGLLRWRSTARAKYVRACAALRLPLIKTHVLQVGRVHFLQAVGLLLKGGIPLVPALRIAAHLISNPFLQQSCTMVAQRVESGESLSKAMACDPLFFEPNLVALVHVGEESSNLSYILLKAALVYQLKVQRSLTMFTTLFQPLCMIILGLLVAILIFALYMPIFNLGAVVG